ncbi:MAG: translation initiation factor IF-3 [Planctomycetota bacterium]
MTLINQNLRCNEQIRVSPVRLIGDNNEQIGILPNYEALRMAREAGLDLVEVAPNVRPPVCRIMDYGKWKYLQKKNVKKHHEQQLKEVRLRPKTDPHDRGIKVRHAIKFFQKGHKVQFTMVFRGRERFRKEVAFEVFREIMNEFGTRVKVERPPSLDGRFMVMILSGVKDAFKDVDTRDVPDELPADDAAQAGAASEKPAAAQPAPPAPQAARPEPQPAVSEGA